MAERLAWIEPRPGVFCFADGDGVQVRHGDRVFVLPGTDERTARALTGTRDRPVQVPQRTAAALLEHRLFAPAHDRARRPGGGAAHDTVAALARRTAGDPEDRLWERLRSCRVRVSGAGRLAERVLALALDAGLAAEPGEPRPGEVVVGCGDSYRPSLFARIDRWSRASGTVWLPAYPSGEAVFVGPLLDPSQALCLRCVELRLLACTTRYRELRAYWAFLDEQPDDYAVPRVLSAADEALAASVVVGDVLAHVTKVGALRSVGNLLELVAGGEQPLTAHPVLAVPSCDSAARA
jgi:bacteriocin biosynthesis cyclodehydratase domain-containing protein